MIHPIHIDIVLVSSGLAILPLVPVLVHTQGGRSIHIRRDTDRRCSKQRSLPDRRPSVVETERETGRRRCWAKSVKLSKADDSAREVGSQSNVWITDLNRNSEPERNLFTQVHTMYYSVEADPPEL
ncbi:hypothetical protein VTO42DRAFT_5885 [Malbranchea cinnamomea]